LDRSVDVDCSSACTDDLELPRDLDRDLWQLSLTRSNSLLKSPHTPFMDLDGTCIFLFSKDSFLWSHTLCPLFRGRLLEDRFMIWLIGSLTIF
jgi:hypothetical protein